MKDNYKCTKLKKTKHNNHKQNTNLKIQKTQKSKAKVNTTYH